MNSHAVASMEKRAPGHAAGSRLQDLTAFAAQLEPNGGSANTAESSSERGPCAGIFPRKVSERACRAAKYVTNRR